MFLFSRYPSIQMRLRCYDAHANKSMIGCPTPSRVT
jgi:hypothetical protein